MLIALNVCLRHTVDGVKTVTPNTYIAVIQVVDNIISTAIGYIHLSNGQEASTLTAQDIPTIMVGVIVLMVVLGVRKAIKG